MGNAFVRMNCCRSYSQHVVHPILWQRQSEMNATAKVCRRDHHRLVDADLGFVLYLFSDVRAERAGDAIDCVFADCPCNDESYYAFKFRVDWRCIAKVVSVANQAHTHGHTQQNMTKNREHILSRRRSRKVEKFIGRLTWDIDTPDVASDGEVECKCHSNATCKAEMRNSRND